MKVSIGTKLRSGPWGGGNQFAHALTAYLQRKGVEVSFDLSDPHLDLIVLTEPRSSLQSSAYTDRDILQYLHGVNPRAIVVHRMNECDARKGTTNVDSTLLRATLCADHTVCVSTWLRNLFLEKGLPNRSSSVICNGSDRTTFHSSGYERWDHRRPMRLVTHHWGGHWLKGFDIYHRLDTMLETAPYKRTLSFTYIGNLPDGFRFRNATHVAPQHGEALAACIRQHHVYITGSQNEPGGNHQNEGANCGLPLLFRESGCLPEYCQGFGVAFTPENFERKLWEMMATYDHWADRMKDYPHTAEQMCERYYRLFVDLLDRRDELVRRRRRWRTPEWMLRTVLRR